MMLNKNQRCVGIFSNLLMLYNMAVWCLLLVKPAMLVDLQPLHLISFFVFTILLQLVSCYYCVFVFVCLYVGTLVTCVYFIYCSKKAIITTRRTKVITNRMTHHPQAKRKAAKRANWQRRVNRCWIAKW